MNITDSKYTIDILLATYNGEKYLSEQIDSIISQTYNNWRIIARDDLSSDSTNQILQQYSSLLGRRFIIINNKHAHLGAAQNFGALLHHSTSNYTMFSDQDDIWHETKIETSLRRMYEEEEKSPETPILIHSDLVVVNEDLKTIAPSFWKYYGLKANKTYFNYLLVKNNITGCTLMMNSNLKKLALNMPENAIMHDWWYGLIASAFGKVIPLSSPLVYYRQHSTNTLGAKEYNITYLIERILKINTREITAFKIKINNTMDQAQAFVNTFHTQLPSAILDIATGYAYANNKYWLGRRVFIIKNKLYSQGFLRTLVMLLII